MALTPCECRSGPCFYFFHFLRFYANSVFSVRQLQWKKKLKSIARFLFEEMGQAEQQGWIHGQYQLLTGGQGRKCVFFHFSICAYRPTDWRTDRQSLLKSWVSAAKKEGGKWKKRKIERKNDGQMEGWTNTARWREMSPRLNKSITERKKEWKKEKQVADGWAGASNPYPHLTCSKKHLKRLFPHFLTRVHGPTDRRTDGWTDKASYRVTCPQLKKEKVSVAHFFSSFFGIILYCIRLKSLNFLIFWCSF